MGVSPLTGKPVAQQNTTAVFDHMKSCDNHVNATNFSVLTSDATDWFLLLKESLLIGLDKPKLNCNVRSVPLSLF